MKNIIVTDRELDPGEVIKQLRNEKNFTLRELAARSGTSKSGLSRWEHGDRVPSVDVYIRILKALDADLVVTREVK